MLLSEQTSCILEEQKTFWPIWRQKVLRCMAYIFIVTGHFWFCNIRMLHILDSAKFACLIQSSQLFQRLYYVQPFARQAPLQCCKCRISQNDRMKVSDFMKPFSKILMVDHSYFHLISNQNREKQMERANTKIKTITKFDYFLLVYN